MTVPAAQLAWKAGLIGIVHRLNSLERPPIGKLLMALPVSPVFAVGAEPLAL